MNATKNDIFIVQAAIRIGEKVWVGHRHNNIIHEIVNETGKKPFEIGKVEQGFVTNTGQFVDRIEGARIAIEAEQIEKLQWPPNLYSEDLY